MQFLLQTTATSCKLLFPRACSLPCPQPSTLAPWGQPAQWSPTHSAQVLGKLSINNIIVYCVNFQYYSELQEIKRPMSALSAGRTGMERAVRESYFRVTQTQHTCIF